MPVKVALLAAIEYLVAGDPGNAELAAQGRHLLALEEPACEIQTVIHRFTLFPGHPAYPRVPSRVNHVLRMICELSIDKLIKLGRRLRRMQRTRS